MTFERGVSQVVLLAVASLLCVSVSFKIIALFVKIALDGILGQALMNFSWISRFFLGFTPDGG